MNVVGTDSYLYDLNGNITKQVTGGATTYYGYNAADQMCWTATTTGTGCTTPSGGTAFTYDGSGNTLTGDTSTGTNTWTNYDQLASVTVGGARSYGYEGTTNAQRASASGVSFTNSVLGTVSSDTGGAAARSYIRDADGTLIALQTSSGSYYYTLDNIGSVLKLTDSTGAAAASYSYNPYGKTTASSGSMATTNTYRYASGYTDGTGLIKFGARYYNPTLARFTQPDPSGQEQNNYTYAADNSISRTDPTGLEDVGCEDTGACTTPSGEQPTGECTGEDGSDLCQPPIDVSSGCNATLAGVAYTAITNFYNPVGWGAALVEAGLATWAFETSC